nr:LOW QUALITY PROTEIN: activating signal cointegrator 1-like [Lepeophtheirus salmonis]
MVQKKYCSKDSLSEWLDKCLCEVLEFSSADEIVSYVLSMDTIESQVNYLKDILDVDGYFKERIAIINEFCTRSNKPIPYKKPPLRESPQKTDKKAEKGNNTSGKGGAKTKYVNFYGDHNADNFVLSGRHFCECQATKHKLINNCLNCGRIICEQEGSGPCMSCDTLVCTKEEMEIVNRGSRKSEQLMKKLMASETKLSKAEAHKNKLLEFDKTCEKRTQVIDDENDYFSTDSNQWLNKNQRETLQQREKVIHDSKYGSRLKKKMTIDLAGRKVVDVNEFLTMTHPRMRLSSPFMKRLLKNPIKKNQAQNNHPSDILNPTIDRPRPQYISKEKEGNPSSKVKRKVLETGENVNRRSGIYQDKELQIMTDSGMCLTMHQPWASYLVAGIKVDEGRSWYSHHRGRLWIHAAAKVAEPKEIQALQEFYKSMYKNPDLKFPVDLPTSCLLGSVDILDVLPQEDYREQFPNGESMSPFVFVADNPQELKLKLPMTGQHKIYKLNPQIHKALSKSLKHGPLNPPLNGT